MAFLDSKHQRAAWLVIILAVICIVALAPYASGLLGAPVLYTILAPMHGWLVPRVRSRALASLIVILVALVGLVLPLTWLVSLLVGQAQDAAGSVLASPLLDRLDTLAIGPFEIGQQLREVGSELVSFMSGSAITVLGKVTRLTLNLLLSFFGLYYILQNPGGAWRGLRPYIPFSDMNANRLKERFEAVTKSTVLGTGLCALAQGLLIGVAFWMANLGDPIFWGAATFVLSVMPVVGSGLIWGPGSLVLFSDGRAGAALAMFIWGIVVVGNVDNIIRPYISNKYAQIHPLITIVGAIAGVSYLGILGLLIGPLALSYLFELLKMYQVEYLPDVTAGGATIPAGGTVPE
jgi:predicted PurR-regulated permease PerM